MAHCLNIGCLSFRLSVCPDNVRLRFIPLYKEIASQEPWYTRPGSFFHVTIRISDKLPPTGSPLFTAHDMWRLHLDDETYTLCYPAEGPGSWQVRFAPRSQEVTIYCHTRMLRRKAGKTWLLNPLSYPVDQLLLMYLLAFRRGAVLHAAGVAREKSALLFLGRSGAGKSTMATLCQQSGAYEVINDDRMVAHIQGRDVLTFGTPWPGRAGFANFKARSIRALCFLLQAEQNRLQPLTVQQALESLLPVASIPWYDRAVFPRILAFCDQLIRQIPAYVLEFAPRTGVLNLVQQLFD